MGEIFSEEVIKLLVSLLVGSIIGAEREYRSKAAGFRTVILVTVGSCLFTILSIQLGDYGNKARIAANIVTGIGFLGAGAIYRDKISIRGLTTATTIWISAALGMAIGNGEYKLTFVVTTIVMVILLSFNGFQKVIDTVNQERTYKIIYSLKPGSIDYIEKLFEKHDLAFSKVKQTRHAAEIIILYAAEGKQDRHETFIAELYQDEHIIGFEV
ncbi:MAG: MgtC/SapB family protein [Cytophagaceae bacterium]|jgi:putative Mg2+ transporter-C (MgtC) family protein|nr:MgtC/SapB family protein [Cytophagaceae bacterium]